MSLLFAFIIMNRDLADRIISFGRGLRYLLSVSDQVCKFVLSTLDGTLTDMFRLMIEEKVVLRFKKLRVVQNERINYND